jgi:hypothetical protein
MRLRILQLTSPTDPAKAIIVKILELPMHKTKGDRSP